MPFSKPHNGKSGSDATAQMGLDFSLENQYIIPPLKGDFALEAELFEKLEEKISTLLSNYSALKEEMRILAEENSRLQQEREGLKGRVDSILNKLEGI